MRAYDIIAKKRDGQSNTAEEIAFLLKGFLAGDTVSEGQMAAWLMAVYYQGMSEEEISILTEQMERSGDQLTFPPSSIPVVDKHSTGGVGDKTTLIVAPLVSAAGVPVGKLSGKGLGFTGGTIDKLSSIPGFQTNLSTKRFFEQLQRIGLVLAGQTANLVPADKKMYALRDLTATVESIPLIASSIMSKKLASGAQKLVLDVKFGSGAFLEDPKDAAKLAQTMVTLGNRLGRQSVAVLSSMDSPLGYTVGNALEVEEAMETLQGHGPADLTELCLTLSGWLLYLGGKAATAAEGYHLAEAQQKNGTGWNQFLNMVEAQGGDLRQGLPQATHQTVLSAPQSGVIQSIHAKTIGHGSMLLGAGRATANDVIDLTAGIRLLKKVGDSVSSGEPIAIAYDSFATTQQREDAVAELLSAYRIGSAAHPQPPLILKVLQ